MPVHLFKTRGLKMKPIILSFLGIYIGAYILDYHPEVIMGSKPLQSFSSERITVKKRL